MRSTPLPDDGFDDRDWPVVRVDLDTPDDDETTRRLTRVNEMLGQGEPMGFVFLVDRLGRNIRERVHTWFGTNDEQLNQWVAGIATVVAPATVARNREVLADHNPFPFPAWVAATEDECVDWLRERIAERKATST